MVNPLRAYTVKQAKVAIYSSTSQLGGAAASDAARLMREAISRKGRARIIVATGNSQLEMIKALTTQEKLDWQSVEVFHMDEYVGIPSSHRASFARWIKDHVADVVHPGKVHYLCGESTDIEESSKSYCERLSSAPVDVCFLGIGENGHIAFNDPPNANFKDPLEIKLVNLDHKCRAQQVGEGHFPTLDAVPKQAVTLTCPTLMSARNLICSIPERRKAEAVRHALEGPLSEGCPGSLVVTHPSARIYLDPESASELSASSVSRISEP